MWPAAAVAVIWMLAAQPWDRRERATHLTLLGVLTFGMNLVTGAPPLLSAWFVVVNVGLALVTVNVLTRRRDEVALRDPADLARLVIAVCAGSLCAAVLATAYLASATGAPAWETFALFAVRNGASALVGVSVWLRLRHVAWGRPRISVTAAVEALLVAGGVGFVFVWIFWLNTGVPMAFLTLVPAMLLALRYSTTVATVFLTVASAWVIVATLSEKGVFVVADVQVRALLAQAMVCSLTVIVLALALYRDSRARLIAELEAARDRADHDSELLSAVLDSIHDSVVLVDPAGRVVLQNARATDSGLVADAVSASHVDSSPGHAVATTRGSPRDVIVGVESRVLELTSTELARQPLFNVMAFRDVTEERKNAEALREARDLFAGVLHAASEQAIIGTDSTGRITVFNNGAERLLGWTQEEMLGRTPMSFHHHPEVCARAAELGVPPGLGVFVHNVTPDRAEVREWTYVRRDGGHVAVSMAVSQMNDGYGRCVGYIGVATDITERKAAERALAESEESFRLAFDTAPMGMFMFDIAPQNAGRITRCNQAMAGLLGRPTADVLGTTVTELGDADDSSGTTGLKRLLSLKIGDPFEAEVPFRRTDGSTMWGAVSASVVAPQGPSPYGICLVEDITSRKRAEDELQHLAMHDPLTGLANRVLLMDRVERALAEAGRHQPQPHCVGLVFLDLDGFKEINDTWGHAHGDAVLEMVARRIETSIRPGDTAARLGGDEFAVLCPVIVDDEQLQGVAEGIRAALDRPVTLAGGQVYDQLSVSVGVITSHPGCTAEVLLQQADSLMYHAKRNGKNRVVVGGGRRETAMPRSARLMPELNRAVGLDEFVLYGQPIVNIVTGDCVAAEALLRWQHPRWGLLAPAQFLEFAEGSRRILDIGRYVLYEACLRAQRWTGPMAGSAVHVNVSGRQLEIGDLRADVLDALAGTGLSADRLVLELTETYAGRVVSSARSDLELLRQEGVRIAIDDVGTGFSGLAKIVDLPIDILKIDKQFIGRLAEDTRCQAITKAVLSLGTNLRLTVIAEGIESDEQRRLLVDWGCTMGQGFLFGKPTPLADAFS